jgi:hypothetical protein
MVCGGLPDWSTIARHIGRQSAYWISVSNAYRSHPHIQYVLVPRYNPDMNADNRDLRIKFMIGDFSEDEFKKRIQQREKARQRKTDIRLVLDMYQAVLVDLFQGFTQNPNVDELVTSLVQLRTHVNSTMDSVSKRWSSCAVPKIHENFDI